LGHVWIQTKSTLAKDKEYYKKGNPSPFDNPEYSNDRNTMVQVNRVLIITNQKKADLLGADLSLSNLNDI
jgi:hypothetical protein